MRVEECYRFVANGRGILSLKLENCQDKIDELKSQFQLYQQQIHQQQNQSQSSSIIQLSDNSQKTLAEMIQTQTDGIAFLIQILNKNEKLLNQMQMLTKT